MRLTKKARRLLRELEEKHPGEVLAVMATRERCRVLVGEEAWDFVWEEGRLLLLNGTHEKVPRTLYRLAFIRADFAIRAVCAGHTQATERRRAEAKIRRGDLKQLGLDV
jgi:hypothetical protein